MKKIQGTYCATLTPFNEDFSINKKLLLEHCNNILKNKVDGIGIFGSTGESNSLSIQQKIETTAPSKVNCVQMQRLWCLN